MEDKLIYGKNSTKGIVSIEVKDDKVVLFIRENGELRTEELPHKYWAVYPTHVKGSVKLDGGLYYHWGKQYATKRDFEIETRSKPDKYIIYNEKEAAMVKDGLSYHKGMNPSDLLIMGIDIETTGLVHNATSKVLLVAVTHRKDGKLFRKLFSYDYYATEKHMLLDLNKYIREVDPDVLLAHNGFSFDFPYLDYIAQRNDMTLDWGRDGSAMHISNRPSKYRVDGSRDLLYPKAKVYGREIIDTMFLSYKYDQATKKYESYGLKQIIAKEGLETAGRVFYDAAQIRFKYMIPEEWAKIKKYCVHDADDLISLYDLMIPPFFYMTNFIPKPFQDMITSASGSQLNSMMCRSYLQDKHSIPKADDIGAFGGAISFGVSGIWNNTIKYDVASLYPSIMLNYKLQDKRKDPKEHLHKIVKVLRERRLYNKSLAKTSEYHDAMQSALKGLINSLYGFLAAPGLNFNYLEGAEFITRTGREILKHAIYWASGEYYNERAELEDTTEDA